MNVLIVGNGSIGKQHTKAVLKLGHSPVILTHHPSQWENVSYISSIDKTPDCQAAIICTPTDQHYEDFYRIINNTGIKSILVEKPIAAKSSDAIEIKKLAEEHKISVFVAFDMRFIPQLQYLKSILPQIEKRMRLIKMHCGQYLPEWRPDTDYRRSYSSYRARGGGVDLDLTHEIDYMLWLFGNPSKIDYLKTYKISSLQINSPDYFKAIYNYEDFIVDVELDYFRKLDRKLIVLGENEILAELDFIKKTLVVEGQKLFLNIEKASLLEEDDEFLNKKEKTTLCSLSESINVLKMIKM